MSFLVFSVFCLVLLLAAYTVVRARLRRYSCREIAGHIKPLSDHAREVVALDTQGNVPETWLEFTDLYRAANNLTWMTMLADRFHRAMNACTDPYTLANMQLTYITFLQKRFTLFRALMTGLVHICTGRIGKRHSSAHMGTIARHYTDELLLAHEMVELMDPLCAPAILEGQLLHGS